MTACTVALAVDRMTCRRTVGAGPQGTVATGVRMTVRTVIRMDSGQDRRQVRAVMAVRCTTRRVRQHIRSCLGLMIFRVMRTVKICVVRCMTGYTGTSRAAVDTFIINVVTQR